MSFLSSLFCCFDTEDTERRESSITTRHSNLTKTQSNLQKALTNKSSQPQLSTGVDSNTGAKNIDHSNNNNSKVPANKATNKTSKNNKDYHKSTHSSQHQSKNNNSRNSKNMEHSDSTNSTNPGTNSTATAVDTKSQHFHEITDLKDSTDSSKDEDTINIHDYQTQNTEETKPLTPSNLSPEFDESKVITQFDGEEKNGPNDINRYKANNADESGYNDNSNNNNENDAHSQDAEMYDEDYDLDLTKIRSDQVVAASGWLLDPPPPSLKNRKCLVLDLDETLVHSSFKYVRQCDFVIPVEIENQVHNVYVIKRPGVDDFLKKCGELFEVVVFTASVSRYGDPLLDILDVHKSVHHRLFRESCYNYQGNYIKNLSQMGRPMEDLIIIDNSPASYIFHPQHSVPISSWFSDSHDCELTDLLPFLEDLANKRVDDVRLVLDVTI